MRETKIASQSVDVDPTKHIRQISMFVTDAWSLAKLRLTDDHGDNFVDLEWTSKYDNRGQWLTRDIPADKTIIGLYCNTQKYDFAIPCVGFTVWT